MSQERARARKAVTRSTSHTRRDGAGADGRRHRTDDVLAAAQAVTEQTRRLRAQTAALAETQLAIREANQRFADLYDFVPVPYLIVSNLGVIEHANESALQMLGGERQWVVGRPLIGYVDVPDMRRVLDGVLTSSRDCSQSLEVRIRVKNGQRLVQMIVRRRSREGEGAQRGTFHIALVDLTELRRLEDERHHADQEREKSQEAERVARAASEAKDDFLAMVSHELRTPLTPILAAADSLVTHNALTDDARVKTEMIRRNVKAEARLVDDLLDVARITKNKLDVHRRPIDLHRVVADVLDGWAAHLAEHQMTLDVHLGAATYWVDGDAGRLGQVLRNIVGNAAKFSEPGGLISVTTENHEGLIRVTVVDHGVGMTEGQIHNLFKPFVRRQQPSARRGLGLGLVISQAIMQAHEGTLEIRSGGPGTGTMACVEMPTVPTPSMEDAQTPAAETPLRTGRVLLVEDDRDSAEMLKTLLALEGFEVEVASSVYAALELAGCCEVLVSDIALPDGSGLDLMREIRRDRPMRGIALSGYGSAQDIRRSLEAGFNEHLTKPVEMDRLVEAVRRLMA